MIPRQPSVPKRTLETASAAAAIIVFEPDDVQNLRGRDFHKTNVLIRRRKAMDHARLDHRGVSGFHNAFPARQLEDPAALVGIHRFMFKAMVLLAEPMPLFN